ncbi:MAG: response regulator transcription factor [Spirochaetales bacterium]|nr:response regulator transcription factor [Spirochaetales bacterium]
MKRTYTIAIIDDEKSIQQTLAYTLESEGYTVHFYDSGSIALEQIKDDLPDLIILDIMMPEIDGITFCSIFRKQNNTIPVIFLSSRIDELSKIEALERGGDDYLTKPFSIKELLVRISVCLRRVEQYRKENTIHSHKKSESPFSVDYAGWEVYVHNHMLNLTVTEFRIFTALYSNPGVVFTREKLMEKAYPEDFYISDRNVDMHITRIRKKICLYYPDFKGIETVYGLGYRYKENQYV